MTNEEFKHRMVTIVTDSEDFEIWHNKYLICGGLLMDLNYFASLLKSFSMDNRFFLKLQIKNSEEKDNAILNSIKEYLQKFEYQILDHQMITKDFSSVTAEFTKLPQSTTILSEL